MGKGLPGQVENGYLSCDPVTEVRHEGVQRHEDCERPLSFPEMEVHPLSLDLFGEVELDFSFGFCGFGLLV